MDLVDYGESVRALAGIECFEEITSDYKLMIPANKAYRGKAQSLSYAKQSLTTIKKHLSAENMKKFEDSCFGHLLRVDEIGWSGNIVHALLLRKVTGKGVNCLKGVTFLVGGQLVQFTQEQFCLISGLRFGKVPRIRAATDENCELKRKYFANKNTVLLRDLEEAFKSCRDSEDSLKLAFVYFAEFIILGSQKTVKINLKYLKLVEKVDEFNKYPWGTMAYGTTHGSLLNALSETKIRVKVAKNTDEKGKGTSLKDGKKREYHIKGFAYAFLVWAYETFPALEELNFAIKEDEPSVPRILNWRTNGVPRASNMMSEVFESEEVEVKSVCPTDLEKSQSFWTWGDGKDAIHGDGAEYDVREAKLDGDGDGLRYGDGTGGCNEKDREQAYTRLDTQSQEKGQASTRPLSLEAIPKVFTKDIGSFQKKLQIASDDLKRVTASNRDLRKRVTELEGLCLKKDKDIEVARATIASMEHHFKCGLEQLKTTLDMMSQNHFFVAPIPNVLVPSKNTAEEHEGDALMKDDSVLGYEVHSTNLIDENAGHVVDEEPEARVFAAATNRRGGSPTTKLDGSQTSPENADTSSLIIDKAAGCGEPELLVANIHSVLPCAEDSRGCKQICDEILECLKCTRQGEALSKCEEARSEADDVEESGDETSVGKWCRIKRQAPILLSPFMYPSRKKRKVSVTEPTATSSTITPTVFYPKIPLCSEDVQALLNLCREWKKDLSAELELEFASPVHALFFYKLINPNDWLDSLHIDMGLFLFRKRQDAHPLVFGSDWTTTDSFFEGFLEPPKQGRDRVKKAVANKTGDEDGRNEKIKQYVLGTWKCGHAHPWSNVRKVYVPIHFGDNTHWVAGELDLVGQAVNVYDSHIHLFAARKLPALLHRLTHTLPRVLYDMGFYATSKIDEVKKHASQTKFQPWAFNRIAGVPQQEDGASCGVLALKFIEYASAGIPIDTIQPDDVRYYRLKLAIEFLRQRAYI